MKPRSGCCVRYAPGRSSPSGEVPTRAGGSPPAEPWAPPQEVAQMLQTLLRYISIVVSAIVVLSFVFFAVDQSKSSSASEVATVGAETSSTTSQAQQQQLQQQQQQQPATPKPKTHGQPRAAIDD